MGKDENLLIDSKPYLKRIGKYISTTDLRKQRQSGAGEVGKTVI